MLQRCRCTGRHTATPSADRCGLCTGLKSRNAMIEEFDIDNDGEINLEEFLAIMLDGE